MSPFRKAVGVIVEGVDVGLDVDIAGFGTRHHAVRLHQHRLQVDRADFHAVAVLRRTDGVLDGQCRQTEGKQQRK